MCLIVCAFRQHPEYPLVLVANRDEFHDRPTRPAGFWEDCPDLLAGRDLQAGGTWMGVTRAGRLAAVTNYREVVRPGPDAPSRGGLVTDFLQSERAPTDWLNTLRGSANRYAGFSLLVGAAGELSYLSNREEGVRGLSPGIYGMSNHLLETPWHKVVHAKQLLGAALEAGRMDQAALLDILAERAAPAGAELPDTGMDEATERMLLPAFILGARYGTRSTTSLTIDRQGKLRFVERSFSPDGNISGEERFQLTVTGW